ncbi:MAG: mRNA-binding ribosome synthesis protein [Marteilia pararefringens]
MVAPLNRTKPSTKGKISTYISRKSAIKRLMINLGDFRKLCVIRGITPRVPPSFSRLNDGGVKRKTYYHSKDISYLSNDPLITTFNEMHQIERKKRRAIRSRDNSKLDTIMSNLKQIDLSSTLRQRYPEFDDALEDLDDCLTICSAFIHMSHTNNRFMNHINLAHRLLFEFLNYIIATKCLKKVFVTLKGYYFQVEICGNRRHLVTFLMPHHYGPQIFDKKSNVDMQLLTTFALFYTTLLGFINYKLYDSLGLKYPLHLKNGLLDNQQLYSEEFLSNSILLQKNCGKVEFDLIKSMLFDLPLSSERRMEIEESNSEHLSLVEEEQLKLQFKNLNNVDFENNSQFQSCLDEEMKKRRIKNLFKGKKFFISRECPRDPLTFSIRSCGGEVCFESISKFVCSINESDPSITHQISDRPAESIFSTTEASNGGSRKEKNLPTRIFIQPQWIFDSINSAKLLEYDDYLIGQKLPPHFSPFENNEDPSRFYISEERAKQLGISSTLDQLTELEKKQIERNIEDDESNAQIKSMKKKNMREKKVNSKAVNIKLPLSHEKLNSRVQEDRDIEEKQLRSIAESQMSHKEVYVYKKLKRREKIYKKVKSRLIKKKFQILARD